MSNLKKIDFLTITKDREIIDRTESICKDFNFSNFLISNLEELTNIGIQGQPFTLLDASHIDRANEIAGMVQSVKMFIPDAFVAIVLDSKIPAETMQFIKKSGAGVVIMKSEITLTSKLEFISTQKIGTEFIPIKVNELKSNTNIGLSIYHILPLNKKFIPVITPGIIEQDKLDKLQRFGEVFVKREDWEKYKKYSNDNQDTSALGLSIRCRNQFLSLSAAYIDLIFLLSDQSEEASYTSGIELYQKCFNLCEELILMMGGAASAWDIINNSAIGTFGSLERATAISAYSGLLSLHSNIGSQAEIMIAALMSEIGLLDLSPKITKKLRDGNAFDDEEMKAYAQYPIMSLNKILSRKLQIPEKLRNIMLSVHEQVDGKGFPNRPRPERIPMESMIIQLSGIIDKYSLIKFDKERKSMSQIKEELLKDLVDFDNKVFSRIFIEKIKLAINEIGSDVNQSVRINLENGNSH